MDYECGGIVSVIWWDFLEKRQKIMEKMSLVCFESCCDMFMAADVGGGFREYSTSFVYSDKLLIWVIITIRLLCLHFNGHFSHFELSVWTLFRSKISCHEDVMKMKTKKNYCYVPGLYILFFPNGTKRYC